MMLRDPWRFVAVLALALCVVAGLAAGQSSRQGKHPAPPPAPDQAVRPDMSSDLPAAAPEEFPDPPPIADPTLPQPPPEAEAVTQPAPKKSTQAAAPLQPEPVEAAPAPPAPPAILAKTPEGRRLQQQTATLLQLAQDLKHELEKAGNDTLSLAALRKAHEIQRMSKDLKDEMSQEQQAAPSK